MKNIYQVLLSFLLLGALLSCSEESQSIADQEHNPGPFYIEFVSCTNGSEYSKSNLSNMIEAWRDLPTSKELRGSFLYDPLKEDNAFGPSMWWELEWNSKDSANEAWSNWSQDDSVAAWSEKYQNVMACDGEGRNAWDILIPISSKHFGNANDSGYFYSQYSTCSYKNSAGRNELENFIPMHTSKVKASDLEGTGYHYGVYFDRRSSDASHSDVAASHIWGEWALSAEAMEIQNKNFTNNFQNIFEEFNKIGSCLENPDTFDSWVLYDQKDIDFRPKF